MTNKTDIEQLFKAHYKELRRVASALLHDDDTARDVVHDVFASLLSSKAQSVVEADTVLRHHSQCGFPVTPGYLLAAVHNRCLNRLRDLNTQSRVRGLYFLEMDEYDSEDWPDESTIARIYEVIRSELTPQCREIMELRFGRGLKFSEIAAELNLSENTVYRHVRQAIVLIRKKISNG